MATANLLPTGAEPHLVRYRPGQSDYRDALIAHEAMHLIRFYKAAPEERYIPVITARHRAEVASDLVEDLGRLAKLGIPIAGIQQLLATYHQGLMSQTVSFPADFRIERELAEHYGDLRVAQEASIRQQLRENRNVYQTPVRTMTPTKVYLASATMNSAFARYMSRLLGNAHLASPWDGTSYWPGGRELADELWGSPDRGYLGDVATAREWSARFGIDRWFDWVLLSDLQRIEVP